MSSRHVEAKFLRVESQGAHRRLYLLLVVDQSDLFPIAASLVAHTILRLFYSSSFTITTTWSAVKASIEGNPADDNRCPLFWIRLEVLQVCVRRREVIIALVRLQEVVRPIAQHIW